MLQYYCKHDVPTCVHIVCTVHTYIHLYVNAIFLHAHKDINMNCSVQCMFIFEYNVH